MDGLNVIILSTAIIHGADVASSQIAFKKGLIEGNPIMPTNVAAMIAVKSSWVIGQNYILKALDKSGHPKLARVIGWIDFSLTAGVVASNIHQIRR